MNKKALIVSPYFDHLGGGERYMLSIAASLESLGFIIYFAWDNLADINSLTTLLGIKLLSPQLDHHVKDLYTSHNPLAMFLATRGYDLVVYLSDGSIPLLGGKKNILHMQVPFHGVGGRSWQNQLKYRFIDKVIVNSKFTKHVIDNEYGIDSHVLYPPVMSIVGDTQKQKIILSVGRFEPSLNTKHQDILIKAFALLSPKLSGWKLVLAGATSSNAWITQLKKMAAGLPIEFALNIPYEDLCRLYAVSQIYWHAAGYGVDEKKNPELTEHFGISTVEAISAGCTPLVVPFGGQHEIVRDEALHWTSIKELVEKTLHFSQVRESNPIDVTAYSVNHFTDKLKSLL